MSLLTYVYCLCVNLAETHSLEQNWREERQSASARSLTSQNKTSAFVTSKTNQFFISEVVLNSYQRIPVICIGIVIGMKLSFCIDMIYYPGTSITIAITQIKVLASVKRLVSVKISKKFLAFFWYWYQYSSSNWIGISIYIILVFFQYLGINWTLFQRCCHFTY